MEVLYCPGQTLEPLELLKMHAILNKINFKIKTPLDHKLLPQAGVTVKHLKEIYKDIIISIVFVDGKEQGFLLSPILHHKKLNIVHSGLVVIVENPGFDLLQLLSVCMSYVAYRKFGKIYFTNISSTPSIIEMFTKFTSLTWPSPEVNLIKSSAIYKDVVKTLFHNYILNFFPHPDEITLDIKRFVLRSASQKMGFKTDFHQLSRSCDFKYLSFCLTWIDYHQEEDIIQVGTFNFKNALKSLFAILFFKFFGDYLLKKKGKHYGKSIQVDTEVKEVINIEDISAGKKDNKIKRKA